MVKIEKLKLKYSYFLSQGGPLTSSERIHCLSSHLTSFGSGTFVAPNPINFRKVALGFTKAFETGNVVVLFTIVALFAVFLMLGVWARRADKRGLLQVRRLGRCYVACLVCVEGCHGVYAGNLASARGNFDSYLRDGGVPCDHAGVI